MGELIRVRPGRRHQGRIGVNETYVAHQGEGPYLGRPSLFIRTHGCPVKCSWCDTPFTWDGSERGRHLTVSEVLDLVEEHRRTDPFENLVVTGGEPLIWPLMADLLVRVLAAFPSIRRVEVETSGVCAPPEPPDALKLWTVGVRWNVSPKLPSARIKAGAPLVEIAEEWSGVPGVRWKFAIADEEDLRVFLALAEGFSLNPADVYLMPVAKRRETLQERQRWLQDALAGLPYRVTTRLHVLAYGEERGR